MTRNLFYNPPKIECNSCGWVGYEEDLEYEEREIHYVVGDYDRYETITVKTCPHCHQYTFGFAEHEEETDE